MLRRLPAAALVACLGVGVAAAPSSALAKKKPKLRSAANYTMTFHAVMKESWNYSESYQDDCELTGVMCTRDANGDGSATVYVDTRGPQPCMNVRGAHGRPPGVCLGADQPAVKVMYQRTGGFKTEYGGPWDAANPDVTQPTTGCGRTTSTDQVGLGWRGRHEIHPSIVISDPHDDCPDGALTSITWQGDGDGPSLMDVGAEAYPQKFIGTKQFTIRGSKKWVGTWGPFARADGNYRYGGTKEVSWQWSATFRLRKRR